jgi:hypothetical protein
MLSPFSISNKTLYKLIIIIIIIIIIIMWAWDSVVGIATRYGVDAQGIESR